MIRSGTSEDKENTDIIRVVSWEKALFLPWAEKEGKNAFEDLKRKGQASCQLF